MPIQIQEVAFGTDSYRTILELRNEVLRRPLGLEVTGQDTAADVHEFHLAAFDHDRLVGCVLLRPIDSHTIKLRQMAVVDSHRGQGIGTKLVRFAEQFAASRGFNSIEMHARLFAQSFYEKLGYTTTGEVFIEVAIPHIAMRKHLPVRP